MNLISGSTLEGHVKWFNPKLGYGFIIPDGDETTEIFAHFSQIRMDGYKKLFPNQRVKFTLIKTEDTNKTKPTLQAESIEPCLDNFQTEFETQLQNTTTP